ncbi:MAG: FAD-dependent oxidoreductase [Candidatus Izimaplasma sp.]|nr:FAD-dependent oxidoreductase [Candidatus Izimaplasma bacterium]
MNYDVIVVGAGPAGIFFAYEMMLKSKHAKVLIVDRGEDIYNRRCPILEGKIDKCPQDPKGVSGCYPACSITSGFGGAGAYSDGKFNITAEFGGWMTEYLSKDDVCDLIKYVDEINIKHGAPDTLTDPTTKAVKIIEKKGLAVGLKLLRAQVRHLGTEVNLGILKSIYDTMKDKVDMMFKTEVKDFAISDSGVEGVILSNGETLYAPYVFVGAGRQGSKWLINTLKSHNIPLYNNHVDIGVRVETNDVIMEEINDHLYEGKFIYNTSLSTQVRTFCSNPSGHVVIENHNGTMLANGHSFYDPKLGTENTNFALLVSHDFKESFNRPNHYAYQIGGLANVLSNGSIIVQKYGDLIKGRKTTVKRLNDNFVKPSLPEAIPGDLGLVLPYKTMKSIIEMIEALDHVTPGIANEHTLLYGVETKFYSAKPEVNRYFETIVPRLFVGGDGAGITRGLAQAGANGVWVARRIANLIEGEK